MVSLRDQVRDLKIGNRKDRQVDYDPEDGEFSRQAESDEATDDEDSADRDLGKEHYEIVGQSKLRQPKQTQLDNKKYGGTVVSKQNLFQDDYYGAADPLAMVEDEDDDPFAVKEDVSHDHESQNDDEESPETATGSVGSGSSGDDGVIGEDEEIDSDEAFGDGEEDDFRDRGFTFKGSGQDLKRLPVSGDEDENEDDEDVTDDEIDTSDTSRSDIDMDDVVTEAFEDENSGGGSEASGFSGEDDEDEDENEEGNEEDESSTARVRPSKMQSRSTVDREKLKALISNDTAAIASSLSATLSADAKKGSAVKKQYQSFDRLLDARIKLQKGLASSTSLGSVDDTTNEQAREALQKAEEAALKLYATIESLRHTIIEAQSTYGSTEQQAGKKRKRSTAPTINTSTADLWSRISQLESESLPTRRQVLDKWSAKTRTAGPVSASSKLHNNNTSSGDYSSSSSKISDVLDTYLVSEQSKFTGPPLSISTTPAEPSAAAPVSENHAASLALPSYDDTNFYQSLLRDLINSRTLLSSSGSISNARSLTNIGPLPSVLKLHASGNVSRAHRVDTKASKGRKIRYTVHEKLENFMASEGFGSSGDIAYDERGAWSDAAVREFFASLLGQKGMLVEDGNEAVEEVEAEEGGVEAEEGGEEEEEEEVEPLRLFRPQS